MEHGQATDEGTVKQGRKASWKNMEKGRPKSASNERRMGMSLGEQVSPFSFLLI
ncbi:hypothetical protein DSM3645_27458 [Blastopirellula marina DSM 3645]|uniref:Uncharacterized protein n=1 Tax=Blastopirellula marina DSM 3645 TaxID=314230 RepID=A3ZX13_9BACT|nr:hypothetical protein DSM3645_27458 [Blastopirellula marina DSM 3645]